MSGPIRTAIMPFATCSPLTVWVVRVGDDLYVRSANGVAGHWFRAAQVRKEGRIQAGGVRKDVAFVAEADDAINAQVDAAYRSKYHRYGARYVNSIVGPETRAATIKLLPRQTNPLSDQRQNGKS